MTNEALSTVLAAAVPIVVLGGAAFITWLAVQVSRYIKDRRLAAAVQVLATGMAGVAASFAQHVVPDLKNPSKVGSWDKIAQHNLKAAGIKTVKRLYPQTIALLRESLVSDEALDEVLGNMLEQAVVSAKVPTAILPAAVQIAKTETTVVNVTESAPVARDANGSEVE